MPATTKYTAHYFSKQDGILAETQEREAKSKQEIIDQHCERTANNFIVIVVPQDQKRTVGGLPIRSFVINNQTTTVKNDARYRLIRRRIGCEVWAGQGKLRESELDTAIDAELKSEKSEKKQGKDK